MDVRERMLVNASIMKLIDERTPTVERHECATTIFNACKQLASSPILISFQSFSSGDDETITGATPQMGEQSLRTNNENAEQTSEFSTAKMERAGLFKLYKESADKIHFEHFLNFTSDTSESPWWHRYVLQCDPGTSAFQALFILNPVKLLQFGSHTISYMKRRRIL